MEMKRPPVGSCWRILVQQPYLVVESGNYKMLGQGIEKGGIFDELVILFAPDPKERARPWAQHNSTTLHLEQVDLRD